MAKWAVIFAGVAALASVTYAIIAGSQLGVMSGQLRQMQQSLAQNRTANELELRPYVHANTVNHFYRGLLQKNRLEFQL